MFRRFCRNLQKRRAERRKVIQKTTYSKMLISTLVLLAALWITWSYLLATHAQLAYGNSDPLMSLSEEVCRTILGAVIVYGTKAGVENVFKGLTGTEEEDPDAVG